jgi:hypothetical protein
MMTKKSSRIEIILSYVNFLPTGKKVAIISVNYMIWLILCVFLVSREKRDFFTLERKNM